MGRKPKETKPKTVSPYTLLTKWFNDGNPNSSIPKEVMEGNAIGPQ